MIFKLRLLCLFALIGTFLITCEDAPEGIQNALFDEVGKSGFIEPTFSITITYDGNNNRSVNWEEFVGFDFYVTNNNELPFTDISITFNGASESVFANFDNDPSSLSIVPSFSSKRPDSYAWCYNESTNTFVNCFSEVYDIYIGSFFFITNNSFGTQSINLDFDISYTYENESYEASHQEFVTIF
jgi:hypothetical protein